MEAFSNEGTPLSSPNVRFDEDCCLRAYVSDVPDPDLRAAIKLHRALGHHFRRGADGSVEPTLEGKHTLGEMAARAP
jgi:hypothetical protein